MRVRIDLREVREEEKKGASGWRERASCNEKGGARRGWTFLQDF